MSTMNQRKAELIADLKLCISYEPNPENDILCMMERYLHEKKEREDILENLHNLLDGKPYDNPYAPYYHYGEEEIGALEKVLSSYESTTVDEVVFSHTVAQLNALNTQCGGEFIDEWRSILLEELLLSGASAVPWAEELLAISKNW